MTAGVTLDSERRAAAFAIVVAVPVFAIASRALHAQTLQRQDSSWHLQMSIARAIGQFYEGVAPAVRPIAAKFRNPTYPGVGGDPTPGSLRFRCAARRIGHGDLRPRVADAVIGARGRDGVRSGIC